MGKNHVYVVDDDASVRNSLRFLLSSANRDVRSFESGDALLDHLDELPPGPVLLDIKMGGMDGLTVQKQMVQRGSSLPVIILTGHGDIGMAVEAMKAGAVDFLTKPCSRADLLAVLDQADERVVDNSAATEQRERAMSKLSGLTVREMQVINELARGLPNKSIGYDLKISPRTVEIHRANVMRKLSVRSFSDALRIAFAAGMPWTEQTLLEHIRKATPHSPAIIGARFSAGT